MSKCIANPLNILIIYRRIYIRQIFLNIIIIMAKNPKSLSYYSNFQVEKCILFKQSSLILHVSFNLWEDSYKPSEGILKISNLSNYDDFEANNLKAASKLHPNFLVLFHDEKILNFHYYFMEYCKGSTLSNSSLINPSSTKINEYQLAYTIKSIIKGIRILHSNGIAHRDIKLDNIFLTFDDHLEIGDFGFSKILTNSEHETVACTLGYQSPQIEMKNMKRDCKKDDMWAFAVCLYKICSRSIGCKIIEKQNYPKITDIQATSKTEFENYQLVNSLLIDDIIKVLIKTCLNFDEEKRADSEFVYLEMKKYCENLYSNKKKVDM